MTIKKIKLIAIDRNSKEWQAYAAAALGGLAMSTPSEVVGVIATGAADLADALWREARRRNNTEAEEGME